LSQDTDIICHN